MNPSDSSRSETIQLGARYARKFTTTTSLSESKLCPVNGIVIKKMQELLAKLKNLRIAASDRVNARKAEADAAQQAWLDAEGKTAVLKKTSEDKTLSYNNQLKLVTDLTTDVKLDTQRFDMMSTNYTREKAEIEEEEEVIRLIIGDLKELTALPPSETQTSTNQPVLKDLRHEASVLAGIHDAGASGRVFMGSLLRQLRTQQLPQYVESDDVIALLQAMLDDFIQRLKTLTEALNLAKTQLAAQQAKLQGSEEKLVTIRDEKNKAYQDVLDSTRVDYKAKYVVAKEIYEDSAQKNAGLDISYAKQIEIVERVIKRVVDHCKWYQDRTSDPSVPPPFPGYTMQVFKLPTSLFNTPTTPDVDKLQMLGENKGIAAVKFWNDNDFVARVPASPVDHLAWRFYGRLQITTGGNYKFCLQSDDGSVLYMDTNAADQKLEMNLVVNNDGLHGCSQKCNTVNLKAGVYRSKIVGYQNDGQGCMYYSYSGPDTGNALKDVPSVDGTDFEHLTPPQAFPGYTMQVYGIAANLQATPNVFLGLPLLGEKQGVAAIDYKSAAEFQAVVPQTPKDLFAWRFFGTLRIVRGGSYTFCLNSDDGSMLWINLLPNDLYGDLSLVVNNDGLHSPQQKCSTISLDTGSYKSEITGYENYGPATVTYTYSGPDTSNQAVTVPSVDGSVFYSDHKPPCPSVAGKWKEEAGSKNTAAIEAGAGKWTSGGRKPFTVGATGDCYTYDLSFPDDQGYTGTLSRDGAKLCMASKLNGKANGCWVRQA